MLIVRLSKRMFLAFPENMPRQYIFCGELRDKTLTEAEPVVEAIVQGRYGE